MSSLSGTNLKIHEIVRCNSPTKSQPQDKIGAFFERHATTRKIVAYLPTILFGGAALIEKVTSRKLLPNISILSVVVMMSVWFFSDTARDCERSLKEKRVERLN